MDALSGRQIAEMMERGAKAGLLLLGHEILERAKANVPVGDPGLDPDPGFSLKESGHLEVEHGGRSVRIAFEGPYAIRQHDGNLRHPRGGRRKYLEVEVLAAIPKAERVIASSVRRYVGG